MGNRAFGKMVMGFEESRDREFGIMVNENSGTADLKFPGKWESVVQDKLIWEILGTRENEY